MQFIVSTVLSALALWSAASHAQPGHLHTPPDRNAAPASEPSRPSSSYGSAFAGYRPFRIDEPLADWRRSNDEMGELSGHIGHIKGVDKKQPSDEPHAPVHSHGGARR